MLKMKFYKSVFIFAFLFSINVSAQNKVITGIVTTLENIPLIGAEVEVKSTKQIVKTDITGKFGVACNVNDELKISAQGFISQKVKLKENIKLVVVNLKLELGEKGKAYAIGYGHVLEADKLTAVSGFEVEKKDYSNYSNMFDLIRGRFAGVDVVGNQIIIRGEKSLNSSNAALIVIDDVITDENILSTLSPINVKSINVIKDGSTAVYGSRGAAGVVLIETKKGGDN